MGINRTSHLFITEAVEELRERWPLRLLLLGDQHLRPNFQRRCGPNTPLRARAFYQREKWCKKALAVDNDGKDKRAKCLDLGEEHPSLWGKWDIVYNGGTLEHMEEQFAAWRNALYALRPGGFFISVTTGLGKWPKPPKWLFTPLFFRALVERNERFLCLSNSKHIQFKHGKVHYFNLQRSNLGDWSVWSYRHPDSEYKGSPTTIKT